MLQLELLWALQCIDRNLSNTKKNNSSKEIYKRLDSIRNQYNSLKKEYDKETAELELNNKASVRLNVDLKHLEYKLEEANRKLYEEGANIKVIDNLQKEMDNCKIKIDNIENELLEVLETTERLNLSINGKKNKLSQLKSQFNALKSEYIASDEANKKKLKELESKRTGIIKEIDGELIRQYNDIACKKSSPVSQVKGGTCMECGVKLNAVLYDALKRKNDVCICDNCGRILYIEAE